MLLRETTCGQQNRHQRAAGILRAVFDPRGLLLEVGPEDQLVLFQIPQVLRQHLLGHAWLIAQQLELRRTSSA